MQPDWAKKTAAGQSSFPPFPPLGGPGKANRQKSAKSNSVVERLASRLGSGFLQGDRAAASLLEWSEKSGDGILNWHQAAQRLLRYFHDAGYTANEIDKLALVDAAVILTGQPQSNKNADTANNASAGQGWEIEAGGFKFRGGPFYPLTGKPLALLRVFVKSPRRQTFGYTDLKAAWDDDPQVGESAIRATLTKLRRILRRVATDSSIDCSDPLPGAHGAWQFALPR